MRNLLGWLHFNMLIIREAIKIPFTFPIFGIPVLIGCILLALGVMGVIKGVIVVVGGLL